jgi:hypothetical protein
VTRRRAFRPSVMSLEQFCAGPVAPPRASITTIIAAARKADLRTYGRADPGRVIAAVVGQLDREQAMEIVLDPTFSTAWKRAAIARLGELEGGAA